MPEYLINLLAQVPLVGIFVWFTLEIMKRQERSNLQRDEQWMAFLKEQAERHNIGLARVAEDVKSNTLEVRALRISSQGATT